MSKKCDICGKGIISGVQYSHSHHQSKRKWAPNVRKIRAIVDGSPKTINVCTRCMRSGKVKRAN